MIRIAFAIAVASMSVVAVAGSSQAAPIAPLSGISTTQTDSNIVQARWWGWHRGWRGGPWRGGPRCWRGRFGRLHCW